ncbi:MAG TPA: manganese efflux pump MntP family protein [Spirochaetota bacterium]|nr:manganese efflux pump MntP family protein [Spirochaetota bacterium]HPJ34040.1 manganese efflux pump MntP family protein [Spirochaetota bacterium]
MSLAVILGIAAGLSMDAFAVSISYGCSASRVPLRHTSMIAFFFGGFQAFMPIIGWYGGTFFAEYIKAYDHWVAFLLLAYVGIKMIIEGFRGMKEEDDSCLSEHFIMDYRKLFILSVATSIDALAVGLSLSLLGIEIFYPSAIIGLTTFAFSFVGVRMGCRLQEFFGKKVEILGGITLLFIGIKILSEHLS